MNLLELIRAKCSYGGREGFPFCELIHTEGDGLPCLPSVTLIYDQLAVPAWEEAHASHHAPWLIIVDMRTSLKPGGKYNDINQYKTVVILKHLHLSDIFA